MSQRDARRDDAVERMADHVLHAGLSAASLRPLATAAGTSDRMLLYYFADKADVLGAVFERIATRLAAALEAALPEGTLLPADALSAALWAGMTAPDLQPYARVWLELAAAAARGEEPHKTIGGQIADYFHGWIVARLDVPEAERDACAARLFAALEGAVLIDAFGRRAIAEAALTPPAPAAG